MASMSGAASGQEPRPCVPPNGGQLVIYRAGSLTAAFKPIVEAFSCQTGVVVKDVAMGSVDAARQITAGGHPCDLYAPADATDIDLFLKPVGLATYTIVFAHGRMVLTYSAKGIARKGLPAVSEAAGGPDETDGLPKAVHDWYKVLARPGVTIGAGHPFLDPGAYRANMIFQLAEAHYGVPSLYNDLLGHLVISPDHGGLGDRFDFQLTYEHTARTAMRRDPDVRAVELPDKVDLSNPALDPYYREHALVALPGLGIPGSPRTVAVPGTHVAWGITVMKNSPNRENALRFLAMLLGPAGKAALAENGPAPIAPAIVSQKDFAALPEQLRSLVKVTR